MHRRISRSLRPAADNARGEWTRVLALAFELERYDTAVESVLTRILRTIDGEVPQGGTWHLDLLKFRHLARHGYAEEPDAVLMDEHAGRVARAHAGLVTSLDTLDGWLRGP